MSSSYYIVQHRGRQVLETDMFFFSDPKLFSFLSPSLFTSLCLGMSSFPLYSNIWGLLHHSLLPPIYMVSLKTISFSANTNLPFSHLTPKTPLGVVSVE